MQLLLLRYVKEGGGRRGRGGNGGNGNEKGDRHEACNPFILARQYGHKQPVDSPSVCVVTVAVVASLESECNVTVSAPIGYAGLILRTDPCL